MYACLFFFNDTATTEIYTLSLHDALPISQQHVALALGPLEDLGVVDPGVDHRAARDVRLVFLALLDRGVMRREIGDARESRSEEHTSELQSRQYLVCRLLLEKKKHLTHFA